MKEMFSAIFEFIVAIGLFIVVMPIFLAAYVGCAIIVGIMDVLGRAKAVGTFSGHYLEPYLIALIIYVIISLVLNFGFSRLEKHLEKWR